MKHTKFIHVNEQNNQQSVIIKPVISKVISHFVKITPQKEETDLLSVDDDLQQSAKVGKSQDEEHYANDSELTGNVLVDKHDGSKTPDLKSDNRCDKLHCEVNRHKDKVILHALFVMLYLLNLVNPTFIICMLIFQDMTTTKLACDVKVRKYLHFVCDVLAKFADIVSGFSKCVIKSLAWWTAKGG